MQSTQGYRFERTPKSVSVSITGACNLTCRYCFYSNEMERLRDLKTDQWLKFFRQLADLSVMDVSLTGGEAFTRKDLFILIDGIIENRMRYNILSNGTLISKEIIEKFMVGKRRQRLDFIQISIDGASPDIHNQSRPDSFEAAIRGLKLLFENDFPVTVRVTINKHNLHDLENIAKLLLEDLNIPAFGTNEAMPIGTGCRSDAEITLSKSEQLEAMRILKSLSERYPNRITGQAGPLAKIDMYNEMDRAKRGESVNTSWEMGRLSACGCIYNKLDILHDGTIVPCCMLPELVLGNITKDSIQEIWHSHPILDALRNRRSIPMTEVKGCERCEWNHHCNGSCPGIAHQLTGDFNQANPVDCIRTFIKENKIENYKDVL